VFLSEKGLCRIHERFGYDTKPLPCRLFPFVLVPVHDHWRVGLRFACPSAAANLGRHLSEHEDALRVFALELARREKLEDQPDGSIIPPPRLDKSHRLPWPDLLRIVDVLLGFLKNARDPMERRLRKCLKFAAEMRGARIGNLEGQQLTDLINIMKGVADSETPADVESLPRPGWIGRILFRQALAIFTRKDHGPQRGLSSKGRIALFRAAWRFTRGKGLIPRMHNALPEVTFEEVEKPLGGLTPEAEAILQRYYLLKVGSLQFCGPAFFGLPFWEGLHILALTFPILAFIVRMYRDRPQAEAVAQALTIVDDHIGFNKLLATFRQRMSFSILANRELPQLIGWYSR
jgi:lysine-N-methylase